MASGEYDIRPATAPPSSDIVAPEGLLALPTPEESTPILFTPRATKSDLKTWALRLWSGRGLIGGLLAIGIAWLGQEALVTRSDFATSTRNYLIAIVIIILSLLHPTLPSFLKRKGQVVKVSVPVAFTSVENEEGHIGNNSSIELPPITSAENENTATVTRPKIYPWARYTTLRGRLGWRVTAPGLALTLGLGMSSFLVLNTDTASPLGGWLWAGSLLALLLTFLGAPGWPRGEGLMPTPWSDWFAPGVPRIPWKVEAALVILMMAVATFMRVWNLDSHPGIFGDEGERGMDARAIFQGGHDNIFGSGWWDVPNMYFYTLSLTFRIFGDNLIGDRMLSVISGLIAVWFVYKTARLLWGPRAGLIAGVMMAVSPLALQFSRLAGESTVTGALWAVGAYFLVMALHYRRWSDWVLSGFFWSFNLYFYASGKLVIGLALAAAVYALIRWRLEFFKRYALGFALMFLAFGLMFMPYGVVSAKDNWQSFMGRANETSIFSPQNQGATFGRYGLAYDPSWINKSAIENIRTNPVAWGSLLYQQAREVLDGIYRRGDEVPFYQVPNLVALAPFWAVLGILGLAYGMWKLWDPRYGLSMLWFVVGMSATILTVDAPNYQRFTNAWPAMMLFPTALIDRIFAAGWPLSVKLAQKWATLPIVAVLLFFTADSYREYFVYYPTTCPYCRDTAQARFAQTLGQDYKSYQMGVGGYNVYFGYGSTRFVAKDVEGIDMVAAADDFPVTDNNDKGLAFILYPNNAAYLSLIRVFYPMGKVEEIKMQNGLTQFTTIKVTKEQVTSTRTLHATYRPANGNPVQRDEPHLGIAIDRPLPQSLTYPVQAEWRGSMVAPQYGVYSFSLAADSSDAVLELDGRPILQPKQGLNVSSGPVTVDMVLAKGIHDVKLSGTLADATGKLQVLWASGGGQPGPIEAKYLFNGTVGGLSGELGPLSGPATDVLKTQDPLGALHRTQRRSDPFIGFKEASVLFTDPSYFAKWQGKLNVPAEGDYGFSLGTSGLGVVMVDNKSVYGNGPDGPATGAPVHLSAGAHDIEARYASQGGSTTIELLWSRPEQPQEIIPPTYLTPLKRSWTKEELPDAPIASLPPPTLPKAAVKQPDLVFGDGDLSRPRGMTVSKEGNIYVGDRGNSRIVEYGPDGKLVRSWGQAAPLPKNGEAAAPFHPGDFGEILDLGVGAEGTVYVIDATSRVQAFSATGEFKGRFEPSELGLYAPNGIDVGGKTSDKYGVGVYIAVTGQNRVLHLPSIDAVNSGQASLPQSLDSIAVGDASGDHLEQPVDVVVDQTGSGLIYAIDLKDRLVQLTPTTSTVNTWTITKQWPIPVGRDDGGSRLAISRDGSKVYMSDPERKRVTIIDVKTDRLSYFGNEGSDPGMFGAPSGIAIGPDGRIYVVDRVNNNVQVFTP